MRLNPKETKDLNRQGKIHHSPFTFIVWKAA